MFRSFESIKELVENIALLHPEEARLLDRPSLTTGHGEI